MTSSPTSRSSENRFRLEIRGVEIVNPGVGGEEDIPFWRTRNNIREMEKKEWAVWI
jgi:hypothetical protein